MATAAARRVAVESITREMVSAILTSDSAKRQIEPVLPRGVSLEEVVSTVYGVAADNPKILRCTPASIVVAVSKGMKWNLVFGDTIHLAVEQVRVMRGNRPDRIEYRAKVLRDYRGDIEMVIRSGGAREITAEPFYANEVLRYEKGTRPYIEHHPIYDPAARGPMVGGYAFAKLSAYSLKIAVLSISELDAIRQEWSPRWKKGEIQPWWVRKTMVHQVTKELSKTKRIREVLSEFSDEHRDTVVDQEAVPA